MCGDTGYSIGGGCTGYRRAGVHVRPSDQQAGRGELPSHVQLLLHGLARPAAGRGVRPATRRRRLAARLRWRRRPLSPFTGGLCPTSATTATSVGSACAPVNGTHGPHPSLATAWPTKEQWSRGRLPPSCDPLQRTLDRRPLRGRRRQRARRLTACGTDNLLDNCRNWPLNEGEVYGVDACDSTTGGCSDIYEVIQCVPDSPPV